MHQQRPNIARRLENLLIPQTSMYWLLAECSLGQNAEVKVNFVLFLLFIYICIETLKPIIHQNITAFILDNAFFIYRSLCEAFPRRIT